MSCKTFKRPCASTRHAKGTDFKALIREYKQKHRPNSLRELDRFRKMPSFELTLLQAAKAVDERGKRFDHQRRHPSAALVRAHQALLRIASELMGCKRFDDLHQRIDQAIASIDNLNEMYVYDTTVRIGAYLGLAPQLIYLHRGTRDGARALGLSVAKGCLNVDELPEALQALSPNELEDFLCIYKRCF